MEEWCKLLQKPGPVVLLFCVPFLGKSASIDEKKSCVI